MRKLWTAGILGVLMLFGTATGFGQNLHRSFELTGYGGARVYDDDVVFLDSGFVVGVKAAWFPNANIGVEGTFSFSNADINLEEAPAGSDIAEDVTAEDVDVTEVAINAIYQFLFQPEQRVVPYFSAGVGQLVFDSDDADFDEPNTSFNYGGGVKIWFTNRVALRLDVRDNLALVDRLESDVRADPNALPGKNEKTFQANNPEFTAGISIGFGGSDEGFAARDTDMDGVPDKDDLCPNTPRGVIVDETGCPVDSDGDGVPDGLDACPNTPQGATVDERGCPLDSDNDGVYDGLDQCPNTPAGVQVDATGCPVEEPEPDTCLGSQPWFTGDATINVDGKNWVKFGATRSVPMDELTRIAEYDEVPVFAGVDEERPYREILLPLCDAENTYQPYRLESEVRGTTGLIRSAN